MDIILFTKKNNLFDYLTLIWFHYNLDIDYYLTSNDSKNILLRSNRDQSHRKVNLRRK